MFYRASTREQARTLGIEGYAGNLPDGRVEVLAIGAPAAVNSLIDWLALGPPAAQVSKVEVQEVALTELGELPGAFSIK